jgi:hypothetical protein
MPAPDPLEYLRKAVVNPPKPIPIPPKPDYGEKDKPVPPVGKHEKDPSVVGDPAKCPRPDKQRHATKPLAWDEARATQKKFASKDVVPYFCECGAWHVGHSRAHLEKRLKQSAWKRKQALRSSKSKTKKR